MDQELKRNVAKVNKKKRQKSLWMKIVGTLGCVVVCCVVYALILPAFTKEKETFCGIEAHEHDDSCYTQVVDTAQSVLSCSLDTLGVHNHAPECFDEQGRVMCGQADYVVHTHDTVCYDVEGNLICSIPEAAQHEHSESCYVIQGAHVHDEACYKVELGELICQKAEDPGHKHEGDCFVPGSTLLCTEAEGHVHGEDCYTSELACTLAEGEEHTHADSCYQNSLSCTLPEGHRHSDSCYEQVLQCEVPESEGHTHEDLCYVQINTLICTQEESGGEEILICTEPQAQSHVHSEACYKTVTDQTLTCTLAEDENHTHSARCYGIWQLTCTKEEHTHELMCYSNPEADVETQDYWDRMFSYVKLTGVWSDDLLTIAEGQLGYQESTQNYIVLEDGTTTNGYTRYGDWYGHNYGDWCAMYVSFCLHYAEVEDIPLNCSCPKWVEELRILDMYYPRDTYEPLPGDLIFFDWEPDGVSDHVGIVVEIIPGTESQPAKVKTIEGNSAERVQYQTYDIDSPNIMGYGKLPENRELKYVCGLSNHTHAEACFDDQGALRCDITEHVHTDACFDSESYSCKLNWHIHNADCYHEDGSLKCALTEHIHSVDCTERIVTFVSDSMRVYVTIRGVENLPHDLTLDVWTVTQQNDPNTYDSMQVALSEQISSTTQYVSEASIFQMQLWSGGAVYELPADADVTVNVKFTDPVFSQDSIANAVDMQAFLLQPEQGEPQADRQESISGSSSSRLLMADASAEEEEETTSEYQAQTPSDADLENADQGLTGITFKSNGLSAFAVALANNIQEGTFWTRVTDSSELASGGTFLIVSAEGNYALRGDNSNTLTPVTLQTVKGNTGYYMITGSDDVNLRWNFSGSGNSFTIQNQGTSNYLYMARYLLRNYLIYSRSSTLTLTYKTPEKCWTIRNGSNYLRKVGDEEQFTFSSEDDFQGDPNAGAWGTYYFSRDMLIFKLSDVTQLQIPPDAVNSGINEDTTTGPPKPDYGDFITPSDSKTGSTAVTDPSDSSVQVSGSYYSDPATTDIEKEFRSESYEDGKPNDGKVLTDKSVIYGADDYGAFQSYAPNTFGVTLSALGQEYPLPYQDIVRTPVDVVFILDVSGSMTTNDTIGSTSSRAQAMTEAVNSSVAEILAQHEENRIGVVVYSGGSWEVLPLDRYTATNDEFFQCVPTDQVHQPTGADNVTHKVIGGNSLRNDEGVSYANAGSNAIQGWGTFTQAGIASGYQLFRNNPDTTYTTSFGEGENLRTYTINRQPVFILLSDGEPTYSTNIYMDALTGPIYGDGTNSELNAKGVHGYYTILSANYYKRMAGIHYQRPALFFTIGMGINNEAQGDGPQVPNSRTGDNYKRAVLNPKPETIASLTTSLHPDTTTTQLKNLLGSSFTDQQVSTLSNWPDTWTGVPHRYVPILHENPYADDYSYADNAYFGNMTADDLKQIFQDILESSISQTPYGFILYKGSSVDLVDNIGAGMEVKGTPVLRYNGVNYTNPTVTTSGNITRYTYSAIHRDPYIPNHTADLSLIDITITTDVDGNQTVEMYVPDAVLPTYTPELLGMQYYYEFLPVRLIYQVGLTEESEQAVLDLKKTGGKLTFYTNEWTNNSDIALSTLIPSTNNPFYYDVFMDGTIPAYHPHNSMKTENTTSTIGYVVDCSQSIAEFDGTRIMYIYHKLGNNGKLVFEADLVDIPVEKAWEVVDPATMPDVEVTLYQVTETTSDEGIVTRKAVAVETITLGTANNWSGKFMAPLPGSDWYYAIGETVPEGYQVSFSGHGIIASVDGIPDTLAKVEFNGETATLVTITNTPDAYLLPETGGAGTYLYTAGGAMLILLALILLYSNKFRYRKEDSASS